jgi:UDP-N-acetylglucosamine 1-carboxyvinyltransferase
MSLTASCTADSAPSGRPDPLDRQEDITILGGTGLSGSVAPGGYKHAMVLSIAASVFSDAPVVIANAPSSTETDVLLSILAELGAGVRRAGTDLEIDTSTLRSCTIPSALSGTIHGSLYLLAPLLGRFGRVSFSGAGGCSIGDPGRNGARPLDHVIEVLESFGARFRIGADGMVEGRAEGLACDEIDIMRWSDDPSRLSGPLVSGATKTALLAALQASRPTTIRNPHDKEACGDLIRLGQRAGAVIERVPGAWIVTASMTRRRPWTHRVMADPTEVMTWICAAVVTRSTLTIGPFDVEAVRAALRYEAPTFQAMGIEFQWRPEHLVVVPPAELRPVDVEAEVCGISTDNHPFFTLMLAGAAGPSSVTDLVWRHRFGYVSCLNQLGTDLTVRPPTVHIAPREPHLCGKDLAPGDTRAAGVTILAALVVPGETRVRNLSHLHRGYDGLLPKLSKLGVPIRGRGEAARVRA